MSNRFYNHLPNQDSIVNAHYQPFYFKQFEVTNAEYREFVNWVRDSIAHTYMGNFLEGEGPEFIDWETEIDYNSEDVSEMYLYNKDGKRLGFNKQLWVFECGLVPSNAVLPHYVLLVLGRHRILDQDHEEPPREHSEHPQLLLRFVCGDLH